MKKYTVTYCSGATGYGWEHDYSRLDEFEDFVNEMRNERTASLTVYDNQRERIVFWKRSLNPADIDLLAEYGRDMRRKP